MRNVFLSFLTIGVIGAGMALAQTSATPDPAAMAQRQVTRLTRMLSLSSAQAGQATSIFTAEAAADQSAMTGLRQARTALATAIKANDTATISTTATTIGTLEAQLTATNAKAQAAFYLILTPDQQAKYHVGGGFGGPGAEMRGQFHRGGAPQQQ
jgi:Spy/CpxP family protein refolding chaperone